MDKNIIEKSVYTCENLFSKVTNCKSMKIYFTFCIPLFFNIRQIFGSSNHTQCNTHGYAPNHVTQHGVEVMEENFKFIK